MSETTRKTLLITGGARGIGRAVALLAGARGWSVAVNYRADRAAADATVADVIAAGGKAIAIAADVADEAQVTDLFAQAHAALGPLDAVVANAGIVAPGMPLAQMDGDRLRRMVEVNLLGALFTAREAARCLPRDAARPAGAIVFVSSAAARNGSAGEYVDYAATKGALDTLTLGLARELAGQNVRVNAVRPGVIETDIHASGGQPDRAWRVADQVPVGRPGLPEEVAEAILWLCSDAASYTTGAVLDVSGGR